MDFSSKWIKVPAALALAAMLASGSLLAAQTPASADDDFGLASPESTDIRTLTCWEVVTLTEDDRGFAMSLLYGYAKGVEGNASFTARNVQVAIINSMMRCVDEPDALVLDVLRDHLAHEE